jgi:hypothetical protein
MSTNQEIQQLIRHSIHFSPRQPHAAIFVLLAAAARAWIVAAHALAAVANRLRFSGWCSCEGLNHSFSCFFALAGPIFCHIL